MSEGQTESFRLGDWFVEPAQGRVSRNGDSISIEPKAMAVLVVLANRSGQVVDLEEILASVWPDTVTSDAAIYQRIALLRRTLGDDSHQPRYIETVPRRGYRLVADVEVAAVDQPPPARLQMRARRWLIASLVIASISGIGYLNINLGGVSGSDPRAANLSLLTTGWSSADSIAVVPLMIVGNPPATEPMVSYQSEEIRQAMAKYAVVKKLSRRSWNGYLDKLPNALVGGLDVTYVVDGTLRVVDGTAQITMRLMQADDGMQVWSREFQRPDNDLDTQTQLARYMARIIDGAIDEQYFMARVQNQTANTDAYEYVHKAEFGTERSTRDGAGRDWGLMKANLQKAIELDPNYGWAYLFLAKHYLFHPGIPHYKRDAQTARTMAVKALELMPNEPDVYWTLGMIDLLLYLDYAAAEENAHQCLSFKPDYSRCHRLLGLSRMRRGDAHGALGPFNRALEASDELMHFWLFAKALTATGDYQRALHVLDSGLAQAPVEKFAQLTEAPSPGQAKQVLFINKANLLAAMGEFDTLNDVINLGFRDYPALRFGFIHHLAKVGRESEARELLNERLAGATRRPVDPIGIYWAYVGLGDLDMAFTWLLKSIEGRKGMDGTLNNLRVPGLFFTEIRNHPRFAEALEMADEIERAARATKVADGQSTL